MRNTFILAAATLCYVAQAVESSAAVIYSQTTPSQPVGAFTSTDRLGYPKVADNFLLNVAQPATVRSIRFIGGYTATMPPPITPPLDALPNDNFRVVLLNDAAGTPGIPLPGGDFAIGTAARRVPTNGTLLNGDQFPIEYTLDLASGIALSPNTVYWISILNDPGPQYGWQWAHGQGVFDQQVAATEGDVTAGAWNVNTVGGMFFALSDSSVPEPPSSASLLVGF
jgi:hypothetical protein